VRAEVGSDVDVLAAPAEAADVLKELLLVLAAGPERAVDVRQLGESVVVEVQLRVESLDGQHFAPPGSDAVFVDHHRPTPGSRSATNRSHRPRPDMGVVKGSTGRNDTEGRDFCADFHLFTS